MDTGLYNGVSALRTAEKRLEAITANLANVDTPGFKRQAGATQAFTVPAAEGYLEVDTRHRSDFSQGDLERSSSPYHLAIDGRGWSGCLVRSRHDAVGAGGAHSLVQ